MVRSVFRRCNQTAVSFPKVLEILVLFLPKFESDVQLLKHETRYGTATVLNQEEVKYTVY